jgi:hypothetical protein
MPTITQSVKFDDQHLQDIANKARGHGSRRGYLLKADPKQKKLQQRWCCVYKNFFFYYESESCPRPLGVIFLEGTQCKEVSSVAGQREGGFTVCTDNVAAKQYFFCAHTEKEREEWVESISNAKYVFITVSPASHHRLTVLVTSPFLIRSQYLITELFRISEPCTVQYVHTALTQLCVRLFGGSNMKF